MLPSQGDLAFLVAVRDVNRHFLGDGQCGSSPLRQQLSSQRNAFKEREDFSSLPIINNNSELWLLLRAVMKVLPKTGLNASMACRRTLDAWDRQRGYNQWALEALGNSTEVSPADMQSVMTCMQLSSRHAKLMHTVCTGDFQLWQCI